MKLDYRMGMCWGFSLMEHDRHWRLLLFVRAVAENQQLSAYDFTLETCENARMWKMINQINKKFTGRKNEQNCSYQYTQKHDHKNISTD